MAFIEKWMHYVTAMWYVSRSLPLFGPLYDQSNELHLTFGVMKAIFTQPSCGIKCGGAPFKVMALSQDHAATRNRHPSVHFVIPQLAIFGIPFVRPILEQICNDRNVHVSLGEELIAVKGKERVAVFKKVSDGSLVERKYDMLHAVPFMAPPRAIATSPLANAAGMMREKLSPSR